MRTWRPSYCRLNVSVINQQASFKYFTKCTIENLNWTLCALLLVTTINMFSFTSTGHSNFKVDFYNINYTQEQEKSFSFWFYSYLIGVMTHAARHSWIWVMMDDPMFFDLLQLSDHLYTDETLQKFRKTSRTSCNCSFSVREKINCKSLEEAKLSCLVYCQYILPPQLLAYLWGYGLQGGTS